MKTAPVYPLGYTLIELVVALALLALVSVLVAEGLRFGLHAWDAVNARLTRADAVAVAQQALRGRLQQLYPYRTVASGAPVPPPLIGQPTELSFSAPGPHALSGQMERFRIYFERESAGLALKITWKADTAQATVDTLTPQSGETLLQNVDGATFEYFAREEDNQGAWMPTWLNPREPPLLVRLRLRFVNGSAGDWPTFVVRPRVTMPADCQFDPVSRTCR